ncbi:M23/M56 family metallopeptidase [Aquimarina sp. 2201CG14-23]|uniref:M23/M56 family metallopeptidase n=1 Tax=Aquimarina mycalae TaxID=3040073 RepID=UPI0024780FA2|nr:M23/M56 family metallopeptidase [Aquimarina sp. 2201CG14-23]MDH7444298.1 M23/M56 family metallopeptidase [Aquimarina sp. 2201CG14-23]
MNNFLIYLLQTSICLIILYITYYIFFRKLTFHKINRFVLLFLLPLSLLFPLLNQIVIPIEHHIIEIPDFDEFISFNAVTDVTKKTTTHSTQKDWNVTQLLYLLYFSGFTLCILRLLFSISHLYILKKKSESFIKNGYRFIVADVPTIFSCLNWIFIPKDNPYKYDQPIIAHEQAHIRLYHTADIIFTEIYVALFWFNPCVYLFRKSIRSIHEFQADKSVVDSQIKKSYYLELLAKNLGVKQSVKLYSYFNHSLIKKRIDMITRTNSNQNNIIKYIVLIPVLVMLFMAFIKPELSSNHIIEQVPEKEMITENPPSIFPIKNGSIDDITARYGPGFNHPIKKKKVFHHGIDIRAKIGTPIIATADGIILNAKNKGDWGNLIIISHTDGYETWYAHLQGFNITEKQQVKKGQIIGYAGNTGLSTGPHLHYEVKLHGKRVNPMHYIKE